MKVFISWSGNRSGQLALELRRWIPQVLQAVEEPWMSQTDVKAGSRWGMELGRVLAEYHFGIVCVTPENIKAPWLHFEAGALAKALDQAKVCPLLLGLRPEDLAGTPFHQFQCCAVSREGVLKLLRTLNDQLGPNKLETSVLQGAFDNNWRDLEERLQTLDGFALDTEEGGCLGDVIEVLSRHGFPEPRFGRLVNFNEGFESHRLYDAIVSVAKNRLYLFGRKNRKLFDKEHNDFLGRLPGMVESGLDLRCLFLDPASPPEVLENAQQDADFPSQLRRCMKHAWSVLHDLDLEPGRFLRAYKIHRNVSLVVADNAVLFTPIELSKSGRVKPLTKCAFSAVDAELPLGQKLIGAFLEQWDVARPLVSPPTTEE